MSDQNTETFTYTYSASQQEEIQKIRKKYIVADHTEMDKMEQLRILDSSVTKKGTVASLIVGLTSVLIMGLGMSLIMTDIGETLQLAEPFILGLVLGVLGMTGVIAAYPIYQRITKKERERIAPQVLQLAEELTKQ